MLRRRRRLRIMVRSLWLGLCVIAAGLGVRLLGYDLRWPFFVFPGAFIFAALTIAGWWSSPSLLHLTRTYDQHFQLHEVLSTGLEVARRSQSSDAAPGPIEQRLIEQPQAAVATLRRRVRSHALLPLRDVEMLLAVALIAAGLLIVGRWSSLPAVAPLAIRPLPVPATPEPERKPQATPEPVSGKDPAGQGAMSPADQEAAAAIADGLRDSGATRSAADSLDNGDTADAASKLRDLAGKADQLSPQARRDLAQGLNDAAKRLDGNQPDRAQRLQDDANKLQGTSPAAPEAIGDVARMIDELGKQGPAAASGTNGEQGKQGNQGTQANQGNQGAQGGQGANQGKTGSGAATGQGGGGGAGNGLGGESRGAATSPPPPGGATMPLPPSPDSGGQRTTAIGPHGPTVQLDAGGTRAADPGTAAGNDSDTPLSGEADPLRIPPEYRDVVERYFSPSH